MSGSTGKCRAAPDALPPRRPGADSVERDTTDRLSAGGREEATLSTPTDPQFLGAPAGPAPSSTQEIPLLAPASAAGATSVQQLPPPSAPAPRSASPEAHRETSPVDFTAGLPGVGAPTPTSTPTSTPAAGSPPVLEDAADAAAAPGAPRDQSAPTAAALVLLSLVLLQVGLTLEFGSESSWSTVPLWSAFATVCVVLGLGAVAELVPGGGRLAGSGWRIAAAGLVGLAVFWILVVLPDAGSDRGFLHTAALGALGGALWLRAGRRAG